MPSDDQIQILQAARDEAQRIIKATATMDPEVRVAMPAAQFQKLGQLLDYVATRAQGDADRFDAPIDGIRFWVPLHYLEMERARVAETQPSYYQQAFDRLMLD
ncbi:hypothetical protein [Sphingomonas adhaesiva]|uniref:hypothetical protein n=1 Tax=Sphingomonas adhaesiva TaxID=28212 RepID=UPI002FFCAE61